ncbi:serine hydrolase domain-containing protein [Stenotrophomonas sp.]|uniref:serine hydrolase domain-containing protein n=1 Tax=Stenotrophomonas sp. TaxID=69392 RepID=UPI002D697D95|nr:serine hydrolase domain-containing protein [Stenotrophomonas sp.]HYQ21904.1 serine hydrolase domain-containing protein [Stenotrophomonas sp.]
MPSTSNGLPATRLYPALITLLLAPGALAQTPPADLQARIDRVEHGLSSRIVVKDRPDQKMTLAERMAFHDVPAVSIALINSQRIEWARAYGVLEPGSTHAATPDSLFQAGSVSKTVAALGALRLVEQGHLSLDTPANAQLQHWKIPDNTLTTQHPVTLRALLNHSAGINVHGFFGHAQGERLPTLLQILDGTAPANSDPIRVEAVPGSAWTYSGGGYTIIQQMMADAGAQPYPQLMQHLVLGPLQMRDSTYATDLPPALRSRTAHAHPSDGQPVAGGWRVYPEAAAAGLWTTASDLARVVLDIQQSGHGAQGKVLTSAMARQMLTRLKGDYGLGLYVEPIGAGTSFAHTGGTHGYRAQIYGYTHTGQGIVVLTNSDSGAALVDEILVSVAAEYGWPEFQIVEKTALAPDAAVSAEVAGDYVLMDTPARVTREGDRLYFQSDLFGARPMELFRQSGREYFMTAQDMTIAFPPATAGKVAGFALKRGASTYSATRKE